MSNVEHTHAHDNDGRIAVAHNPQYGLPIMIWLILVSLTVFTVAVAGMNLGTYTLMVAMLVAAVKSAYVINIFMHIKFEDLLFKIFFALVIIVMLVIFALTGLDIFFRTTI